MRKQLALLLAALMLVPTLASCSNPDVNQGDVTTNSPSVVTTAPVVETVNPYDENGYIKDDLAADINLEEATVNILYWEDVEKPEFFVQELNADIVNDAIYNRNQTVEKRLNVKLGYVGTKGNFQNQANFVSEARKSISAGTGDYDIFAGYSLTGSTLAMEGLTHNLLELDHLNFEQPWWPQTLISEATINDKLYFASGDISTNLLHMMYAFFFNREMIEDYKLEDPFTLVEQGKWTVDKMIELSTGVYKDLNGDNQKDNQDEYGFVTIDLHFDSFFSGANLKTIEKTNDGQLVISEKFNSENTNKLITKLTDFFFNTTYAYANGTTSKDLNTVFFKEGRALFTVDRSYLAENHLREVDFTYGILPVPKYEESQENYVTCMAFPYTLYSISTGSTQENAAAAVLECLASESYRQVTPMLFETAMKVKYASDEKNAQMYDIIRESVSIDLGRIFTTQLLNYTYSLFRDTVRYNYTNYSSQYSKVESMINKLLVNVNAKFAN